VSESTINGGFALCGSQAKDRLTSKLLITTEGRTSVPMRPIHPGEILREEVLAEHGLNARQMAEALGVPANRVTEILRGRRSITADTALRLAQWLDTTPDVWLNLQKSYDLAVAELEHGEEIKRSVRKLESAA
jgi:addiction module HigA family antidote